MKIDFRGLLAPLLALVALVMVISVTVASLRDSGAWAKRPARRTTAPPESPYARLDRELGRISQSGPADNLRDPFAYGGVSVAQVAHSVRPKPVKPVPPPEPVLTAIIWDNDPRALVHWGDRDFTVRSGDQFAEFRVISIARDQVVLDHRGVPKTLRRPIKGD